MYQVYLSKFNNVYRNIAIERYLFENSGDDIILFLWSNTPCVVFGRNQNIYNEVNIDYANEKGIDLVRRFSGGGAVYQDLGNLNYTFIYKNNDDTLKINELLLKTFKNLNLDVSFSSRNDLLINDKKFSGLAVCYDFDHIMYHGTCLIDVNKDELVNVLKPHDYKLKTHSVTSYKSRVINLKEVNENLTHQDIVDSFLKTLNIKDINIIELNEEILEIEKKLKDKDFIYNDSPKFSYHLDIKLNGSNYSFDIEYNGGEIDDVSVYSDDLNLTKINDYKNALIHKKIEFKNLANYLKKL